MSSLRDKLLENAVRPKAHSVYLAGLDHHVTFVAPTKTQMQRASMHIAVTSDSGDQLAELVIALVRWGLREQSGKLALASYAEAEQLIDSLDDVDTETLQAALRESGALAQFGLTTTDADAPDEDADGDPVDAGKAFSGTTPDS